MAQLTEHPALDFDSDHNLLVVGMELQVGIRVYSGQAAGDPLSPSVSFCPCSANAE